MIKKIDSTNYSCMLMLALGPDEEHRKIMRKLMAYGITPTGKKSADKALLREIELKLAKLENCVTGKFLTVSRSEQEKIQKEKKEKRIENNPELGENTMKGQKILGEQLMLAIQMKKDKEKAFKKKKEEEKRRTKEI